MAEQRFPDPGSLPTIQVQFVVAEAPDVVCRYGQSPLETGN